MTPTQAPQDKNWKQTICVLCYVNCGVEVQTDGRSIRKVRGDRANGKSHGYACQKAQRLAYYGPQAHRLTHPLKRRPDGSGHDEITWEQALNSQERLGPDKVEWDGKFEPHALAQPGKTRFV